MKKWVCFFILNIFFVFPAWAADTLTAKVNRNPVPVGETFVLTLEYDGDPGSRRPDFSILNHDFTVYMVSNSYKGTYTNGTMKKLYIWNVSMAADQTGTFTIPELSVNGAKSRPINLKVTDGGSPNQGAASPAAAADTSPKFKVSRSISTSNPLVQQQINYTFKIVTKEALQGNAPQFISADGGDDWIIRALGNPTVDTRIKDGVEEREITFNYALFPQKSGDLVIPEVRFDGYYVDPDAQSHSMQRLLGAFGGLSDDAFGLDMFGSRVPVMLKARPISIKVGKIPAENNGYWWLPAQKAEIYSDWQKQMPKFKSGEAVNREIYLRVTGVIDTQMPDIKFPDIPGFRQYPEKPVIQSDVKNGDIVSVMKVNTVYIPETSGRATIPEIAVNWYNVKTQKMEKAVLPAVEVDVAPGAAAVVEAAANPVEAARPSAAPEQTPPPAAAVPSPFALVWYLLAAFAGGIAVSMAVVYWLLRPRVPQTIRPMAEKTADSHVGMTKAIRNNDLRAVRDHVLSWAKKTFPDREVLNLDDVAALTGDAAFSAGLNKLQKALYSGRSDDFNSEEFMKAFTRVSRRGKKRSQENERLLPDLYK